MTAAAANDLPTIGVTGASGFIGSALLSRLSQSGAKTVALSRSSLPSMPLEAEWRALPELDGGSGLDEVISGIDILVHCAARVHMVRDAASDPLQAFRAVNRDGTARLAEAAARQGVRHFIFVSSIKVNGEETPTGRPFGPDDPPAPREPYGISKAEAEAELRAVSERTGLLVTIVRPVLVYGPGVRANFAALGKMARSRVPLPLGSVRNRRSIVYLGNLVDLLTKLVFGEVKGGVVLLASDGAPVSTAELVRMMSEAQGKRARMMNVPPSILKILASLAGRREIANRLLGSLETDVDHLLAAGWVPPYTLAEGIARTFHRSE